MKVQSNLNINKKALDENPSKKYIFLEDYQNVKKDSVLNGKENYDGSSIIFSLNVNEIPNNSSNPLYLIHVPYGAGHNIVKLITDQNLVNKDVAPETFLQKHKNHLLIIGAVVLGYLAYKKFKK